MDEIIAQEEDEGRYEPNLEDCKDDAQRAEKRKRYAQSRLEDGCARDFLYKAADMLEK